MYWGECKIQLNFKGHVIILKTIYNINVANDSMSKYI